MSAIAGIVALERDRTVSKDVLVSMLEAMRPAVSSKIHALVVPECRAVLGSVAYGPDAQEVSMIGERKGSPRVLCVGELYNDELTQYGGSGEFLAERYRQRKLDDFASGLNGSFAAAIADEQAGSVTLITDQTASLALFTVVHEGRLHFASEVKGLLAIPGLPCQPDPLAVLSLAARGHFLGRRTLVENVQGMEYATVLHVRNGEVRSWPYWRYLIQPGQDKGSAHYIDEFAGLMRQAVQRRVRTGRCAILLSGGHDCRGILCGADDPSRLPAISYTVRTRETRHKLGDWAVAESVAVLLGMEHSVVHADGRDYAKAIEESVYYSDGAASFIAENVWGHIKEETDIEYLLLGDECLGLTNGPMSRSQVLATLGCYPLTGMMDFDELVRSDRRALLTGQADDEMAAILASTDARAPGDCVDELYLRQLMVHFLGPKRRVIGRHGFGVRNPWLDLDVLNFMRELPIRYRIRKRLFRDTIKHLSPSLFAVPRARANETIDYRSILGTVEREESGVSRMFFNDNPLFNDIFDVSAVKALIQDVCSASGNAAVSSGFNLRSAVRSAIFSTLPPPIRARLAASYRYVLGRPLRVQKVRRLLQMMAVAESLRQLNRRFAPATDG